MKKMVFITRQFYNISKSSNDLTEWLDLFLFNFPLNNLDNGNISGQKR